VLAAAGERGRSRDQLLGLFWPEVSQDRARHSLEQTLYAIRGSLDPGVFLGVNPIRLNPGVITSDVEEFETALGRGEQGAAIEHYRGPFLDGFYLDDAPEFERWVETERTRLRRSYVEAVERMAAAAEGAGRWLDAVGWWRRLADEDPVSERYAIGLMRALAGAGDRSSALRHAEAHRAVVRRELGTDAGQDVAAYAAGLRTAVVTGPPSPLQAGGRQPSTTRPPAAPDDIVETATAAAAALEVVPVSAPPASRRWTGRTVVALLAAAVILTALRVTGGLRRGDHGPAVAPSIVVLPLTNLSAEAGDAAFADGMTEELTSVLAKLGGLRVASSTSAFALRGRQLDARQIAESLGVSHVLEGALQRYGSRMRLQVRLVEARDGSTRWSEVYDREMADVFATEDDLARTVARELEVRLVPGRLAAVARHRTTNIAAYELYLRGRDPTLLRSDSGARAGLAAFSQAAALDSTFAAAYAGMAHMYGVLGLGSAPEMPRRELHAKAEVAARRAVTLDDSLAEAHAELGFVLLAGLRDLGSAEAELRRALALDPSQPKVHEYLAVLAVLRGDLAEGLAEAREGAARDPLSPTANAELARALYLNGRCDEALPLLARMVAMHPPLRRATVIAGLCLADEGRWPEAIATLRRGAETGGPRASAVLGSVLARSGRTAEARRILDDLQRRQQRGGDLAFEIAMVYAGLGDLDNAFRWLERAMDEGSLSPEIMGSTFRTLREDPRFERFRRRLVAPAGSRPATG